MKCRTPWGQRGGGGGDGLYLFFPLFLPTNTIAHQRELFGGNLEPSKTITTTYKNNRQRGKITPIWSVGELAKTGF